MNPSASGAEPEHKAVWDAAIDLLKRCTVCSCGNEGADVWSCKRCNGRTESEVGKPSGSRSIQQRSTE